MNKILQFLNEVFECNSLAHAIITTAICFIAIILFFIFLTAFPWLLLVLCILFLSILVITEYKNFKAD